MYLTSTTGKSTTTAVRSVDGKASGEKGEVGWLHQEKEATTRRG